ncbi:hypothetical protein AYI69_g6807 [Smittium culicis]|uniref:Uncharacterized protein n=1 Tax=Smittium culicis TaxID=133412 RepID=A0A1R1XWE5_9FUNG|nr:hypothetical protein AYI69_g6807 [Smittium culicis]
MGQAEYEEIEAVGPKDSTDVEEDGKASDILRSNLLLIIPTFGILGAKFPKDSRKVRPGELVTPGCVL